MTNTNDPRDASLETRVTFPKSWRQEENDTWGSSNMLLCGIIMMTRNRYLAWPAIFVGITGYVNQHPLRMKDGGSGLSNILMAVLALIASYMPLILITTPRNLQVPLPTN